MRAKACTCTSSFVSCLAQMRENPSCKASLVRGSTSALMYIHVRVCGYTQTPMCSVVVSRLGTRVSSSSCGCVCALRVWFGWV